jgi:hypothetical protein
MLVLLSGEIYEVEMASGGTIYIPSLMTIGFCIEAILKFCLSNSRSCDVGISNGRDL